MIAVAMVSIVALCALVGAVVATIAIVAYWKRQARAASQHATVVRRDGIAVVTLSSRALHSPIAKVQTAVLLDRILQEGMRAVVLDLSRLEGGFTDDSAFGPVVRTCAALRKLPGGMAVLIGPAGRVRWSYEFEALRRLGELGALTICDNLSQAEDYLRARDPGTIQQNPGSSPDAGASA
jgi:hypothetical protein